MSILHHVVRTDRGTEMPLTTYENSVILIVNTASLCGFTHQYHGLQKLQDRFGSQGFTILAFPCNQFGAQEPGSSREIASFCDRRFHTTFPIFEKEEVKGAGAHPLFVELTNTLPGVFGQEIRWNFTKFLIDRTGNPRHRFGSIIPPACISPFIQRLLEEKNLFSPD